MMAGGSGRAAASAALAQCKECHVMHILWCGVVWYAMQCACIVEDAEQSIMSCCSRLSLSARSIAMYRRCDRVGFECAPFRKKSHPG